MSLPPLEAWSRIDLHMHSTGSDGRFAPEEVLERAAAGGLDLIALTDHDLPPQLPHGRVVIKGHPLHVLHGVELSGHHRGQELHLLAYFNGAMPRDFQNFCRGLARARADRYDQARERLGIEELPQAGPRAWAGEKALTRLHLSQALVAQGHARDLRDAFDRFTGSKHGMVPQVGLSFADAIRATRAAGGLCSWAHPPLELARTLTAELAALGLQGLEGMRPGLGRQTRRVLARLARKHDLVLTGGSDWHGWSPGPRLGDFAVQGQQAEPFTKALRAA